MVYFIGHAIKHGNSWMAISVVPEYLDMSQDLSPRKLSCTSPSLQFIWQPGRRMKPIFPIIIKTTYIIQFQNLWRKYLAKLKKFRNFYLIKKRELYGKF